MLDSPSNKPSKFRTRNWVKINDDIRGTYSPNKQIRCKTAILRSSLCDRSDAYILVRGNILRLKVLLQIILIKKKYLKLVLHLLTA